jgi:hypothetical protein
MFRFNRSGDLAGRRALASAAAALADDEPIGGAPAPEAPKPGDEDEDGAQPGGAPAGDDADGAATTDEDGAGDGDGSGAEPGAEPGAAPAGDEDGDAHSEASLAAGRAQMHERIETVFAADECVGRESAAASLLAADLPTDKVISMLGKLPKGAAADAMLSRLAAEAGAAPVVAPGATEQNTGPKADVWGNAHKRAGFTNE